MMLADGVAALVGSINFANGTLDGRRELAIEVRDDDVVDRLHKVARHDWEHSHPLDLSDEGLLADLEGRTEDGAQLLALDPEADTRASSRSIPSQSSCQSAGAPPARRHVNRTPSRLIRDSRRLLSTIASARRR